MSINLKKRVSALEDVQSTLCAVVKMRYKCGVGSYDPTMEVARNTTREKIFALDKYILSAELFARMIDRYEEGVVPVFSRAAVYAALQELGVKEDVACNLDAFCMCLELAITKFINGVQEIYAAIGCSQLDAAKHANDICIALGEQVDLAKDYVDCCIRNRTGRTKLNKSATLARVQSISSEISHILAEDRKVYGK